MKMTILNAFHDKYKFSTIYKVGDVVEFEEERAQDLINRGLATPAEVEEEKSEVVVETVEKAEVAEETPKNTEEAAEEPKRRGRKPKGE